MQECFELFFAGGIGVFAAELVRRVLSWLCKQAAIEIPVGDRVWQRAVRARQRGRHETGAPALRYRPASLVW